MNNDSRIDFTQEVSAEGRNGVMAALALDISLKGDVVVIAPINSRQVVGRCYIEVPATEEDLAEMASTFQRIAKRIGREPSVRSVEYTRSVESLGRNGVMKTLGIQTFAWRSGVIRISPVNSRGEVGRCEIEIPAVNRDLMAVASRFAALQVEVLRHTAAA